MIELKRKELEFQYEGKTYKVRKPSMQELENLGSKAESEKESFRAVVDILDQCGFPKDVYLSLDAELASIVTEEVLGKKKN